MVWHSELMVVQVKANDLLFMSYTVPQVGLAHCMMGYHVCFDLGTYSIPCHTMWLFESDYLDSCWTLTVVTLPCNPGVSVCFCANQIFSSQSANLDRHYTALLHVAQIIWPKNWSMVCSASNNFARPSLRTDENSQSNWCCTYDYLVLCGGGCF